MILPTKESTMSQDLLYSILPRSTNNNVSRVKGGVKKIDKIAKKGIVDEEHTTLDAENPQLNVDKTPKKNKPSRGDKENGLDTYA
jgi:hypothetical protein